MSVPFREEETGALARAEALEIENQELREEIERLKDRIGENRDAYVTNIENQLKALKSEIVEVKAQRPWRPARPVPTIIDAETGFALGVVGVVTFIIGLVSFFLRAH